MKQIDWSEAPEGYDKAYTTGPKWDGAYSHKGEVRFARINASGYPQTSSGFCLEIGVSSWVFVEDRPAAPQWSGEGLPPVGVECEYQRNDVIYKQAWVAVTPRYIGEPVTVLKHSASGNEFTEMTASCVFRPIRTPEQIAAEERLAAINWMEIDAGMCATAFDGDPEVRVWVENLVDKGWRKVEPGKDG